jgi:hypothetical protein
MAGPRDAGKKKRGKKGSWAGLALLGRERERERASE